MKVKLGLLAQLSKYMTPYGTLSKRWQEFLQGYKEVREQNQSEWMATLKKTVSKRAEATVRNYLTTDQEKSATNSESTRKQGKTSISRMGAYHKSHGDKQRQYSRVMKTESSDNDKKTWGAVWKEQSIKKYTAARAGKCIENGAQELTKQEPWKFRMEEKGIRRHKDRCCQGHTVRMQQINKTQLVRSGDQKVISWREVRSRKSKRAKMIEEEPL